MASQIEWIQARGSLRGIARWLLLATIVIAPWLYGGTTASSIELIDAMLGLVLVFWLASLCVDQRIPVLPPGLAITAGAVLLLGWWMTVNAYAVYDSVFQRFVPLVPVSRALPGTTDYVLTLAMMLRVTALIGVVFVATEMAQRPTWLLRIWIALAISGGSIALFGLIQKATDARMIFWQPPVWPPMENFFATYFYHSNAGAFLNLVLPPAAGLAVWKMMRGGSPWMRIGSLGIALLVLLAIVSNTSRAAQLLGLALVLVMALALTRPALRLAARTDVRTLIIAALLLAITIASIAQAVRLDRPLRRWNELPGQLPTSARWTAYRLAANNLGDSGWFGFGPGTFRAVFPHYQQLSGNQPSGTWRFLHNDYLQTIWEWGWVGGLSIGALFFGGIAVGVRNYWKAKACSNRQRILLACVLLALGGVALHAAVDFPLQIYSIQIVVATYLGICWGTGNWGAKEEGGIRK